MADTASWAWFGAGPWPSVGPSEDEVASGAGLVLPGSSHAEIVWRDANGDGVIGDSDIDDGSTAASGDAVIVGGVVRTVKEVGNYTGSTLTVHGTPTSVPVAVWLFTDGSYLLRIADAAIPPGVHHSAVDSIQLGTFDGAEYSGSYVSTRDAPFLCFAAGTRILTPSGERPVEAIRPGDAVETMDHGARPVRWAGARRVAGTGRMAPVLIAAGALGNRRDLRVSPQHRLLLSGPRAELLFGEREVLVAATHLEDGRRIRREPCVAVTYVHLLFDRHEIVWGEGCPSESFHPGAEGARALDRAQREEVLALFPALATPEGGPRTARPCLRSWEARALLG